MGQLCQQQGSLASSTYLAINLGPSLEHCNRLLWRGGRGRRVSLRGGGGGAGEGGAGEGGAVHPADRRPVLQQLRHHLQGCCQGEVQRSVREDLSDCLERQSIQCNDQSVQETPCQGVRRLLALVQQFLRSPCRDPRASDCVQEPV